MRVLGGYDPYVGQPHREALAPGPGLRKRMFPAVGRPGVILVDGRLAALWRGRKRGEVLDVEVEGLDGQTADVAGELEAVARLRGCAAVRVQA